MRKFVLLFVVILTSVFVVSGVPTVPNSELRRLEKLAQNVQITRDDWGIAHVKGKTDADAVFGAI